MDGKYGWMGGWVNVWYSGAAVAVTGTCAALLLYVSSLLYWVAFLPGGEITINNDIGRRCKDFLVK